MVSLYLHVLASKSHLKAKYGCAAHASYEECDEQ